MPNIALTDPMPAPLSPADALADIPAVRERTRRWVAYILLGYLGSVIAVTLIVLFSEGVALQRAKDLIGLVLSSVTGLVGTVLGFYFGAQTAAESANP